MKIPGNEKFRRLEFFPAYEFLAGVGPRQHAAFSHTEQARLSRN